MVCLRDSSYGREWESLILFPARSISFLKTSVSIIHHNSLTQNRQNEKLYKIILDFSPKLVTSDSSLPEGREHIMQCFDFLASSQSIPLCSEFYCLSVHWTLQSICGIHGFWVLETKVLLYLSRHKGPCLTFLNNSLIIRYLVCQ